MTLRRRGYLSEGGARKRFRDYNWREVAKFIPRAKLVEKLRDEVMIFVPVGNSRYIISENGGELNISKVVPIGESVPYWSNAHPGGAVGPETLAYRIDAAIKGNRIDYDLDLDNPSFD